MEDSHPFGFMFPSRSVTSRTVGFSCVAQFDREFNRYHRESAPQIADRNQNIIMVRGFTLFQLRGKL